MIGGLRLFLGRCRCPIDPTWLCGPAVPHDMIHVRSYRCTGVLVPCLVLGHHAIASESCLRGRPNHRGVISNSRPRRLSVAE